LPLFEFSCSDCSTVTERFFHTYRASQGDQRCACGASMTKLLPRVVFQTFTPFTTNHIMPDGSAVHVRSRGQLEGLMKRYNLVESRTNHCQFGGDVRSIPLSGEPTGSPRKRRRSGSVKKFTPRQAEAVSESAKTSNYGMG